jgi:hypothetical protein
VQLVITKAKSGDVRPHGQQDAWVELVIQTYPDEDMQQLFEGFEAIHETVVFAA